MNLNEIEKLIDKVNSAGLTEFTFETEHEKLSIKKEKQLVSIVESPVMTATPAPVANVTVNQANTSAEIKQEAVKAGHVIKSPIVGTFYAAGNPTAAPFVKVGDKVKKGQVVCIVEAMKLMNEIESDVDGEIIEVLAKSSQMVEYDQALFLVKE